MKIKAFSIITVILLFAFLQACIEPNKRQTINFTNDNLDLELLRLDKDLSGLSDQSFDEEIEAIKEKYGTFLDIYLFDVMRFIPDSNQQNAYPKKAMLEVFNNPYVIELQDSVDLAFNDLSETEKKLEEAFRYVNHYFPSKMDKTPKVIACLTEFAYGAFSIEHDYLGLGLDMYLGENFRYYPFLDFPIYILHKLEQEYMVRNLLEVWYNEHLQTEFEDQQVLLFEMIKEGKKIAYLAYCIPELEMETVLGYTKEEYEWCVASEPSIWQFMVEKDILYDNDLANLSRFLRDGPFTTGFPQESPGNIGAFMGYKIVEAYLSKQDELDLELLIATPEKEIYRLSGYRPDF